MSLIVIMKYFNLCARRQSAIKKSKLRMTAVTFLPGKNISSACGITVRDMSGAPNNAGWVGTYQG